MAAFFVLVGCTVLFFVLAYTVPQLYDSVAEQTAWCLIPPIALQIGLMTRFNVQTATKTGVFGDILDDSVDFGIIVLMLVVDIFLFSFLAWHLGQVVPSEFGVTKAPWFLCERSFWCRSTRATTRDRDSARDQTGIMVDEGPPIPIESVDSLEEPTVVIDRLSKTFGSFAAVRSLSLRLIEGQCLDLCGHNGAGKSTAISCLTGIITPSSPLPAQASRSLIFDQRYCKGRHHPMDVEDP